MAHHTWRQASGATFCPKPTLLVTDDSLNFALVALVKFATRFSLAPATITRMPTTFTLGAHELSPTRAGTVARFAIVGTRFPVRRGGLLASRRPQFRLTPLAPPPLPLPLSFASWRRLESTLPFGALVT